MLRRKRVFLLSFSHSLWSSSSSPSPLSSEACDCRLGRSGVCTDTPIRSPAFFSSSAPKVQLESFRSLALHACEVKRLLAVSLTSCRKRKMGKKKTSGRFLLSSFAASSADGFRKKKKEKENDRRIIISLGTYDGGLLGYFLSSSSLLTLCPSPSSSPPWEDAGSEKKAMKTREAELKNDSRSDKHALDGIKEEREDEQDDDSDRVFSSSPPPIQLKILFALNPHVVGLKTEKGGCVNNSFLSQMIYIKDLGVLFCFRDSSLSIPLFLLLSFSSTTSSDSSICSSLSLCVSTHIHKDVHTRLPLSLSLCACPCRERARKKFLLLLILSRSLLSPKSGRLIAPDSSVSFQLKLSLLTYLSFCSRVSFPCHTASQLAS